jgi:hypothetical protein
MTALAGCGDTSPADADEPPFQPGEWSTLVARDWSAPPGSADTYRCTRIEVKEDLWISGFRPIAPLGTHHTVVTVSTTAWPLGDYDCGVGSLDLQMLYASGPGTDELVFPPGVGMRVRAGQFIHLNLHLFNASDQAMSGMSGIEVKVMADADVVHEADMTFAGSRDINIPSDGLPHEVAGGCIAPRDWNVFTLWPHMHQFATHQKVVVTPSGGPPQTVLDDAYSFTEQRNYPMPTLAIPEGARIDVTCTYVNTSGVIVRFGDSSNEEMCFAGMYKYPAGGHLFECAL